MDFRGVLLVGVVGLGGGALLGATAACSGVDPGQVTFSERIRGPGIDTTSGGGSSGVNPEGGTSSGTLEAGTDGGSSGVAVTAFTGSTYNAAGTANGSSQNAAHPNGGNPAGVDCMTCHGAGGGAGAKWGIAGTVYNSAAGTAPIAKAQVRVVDATGKELANVYSDALGNFWADAINGGLPGGAKVGARNATITKLMGTALTTQDAACQKAGCHVAGAQGRVYLQ